jgi:hypothetical protein
MTDYADAITATYRRASAAQLAAGREWYPAAGRIVSAIADATSFDVVRVTHALAALSPRNPWRWNVADCYSYAVAARDGAPMPPATTFTRNRERAWAALAGDKVWAGPALKVRAFVAAVTGDDSAVVVDIWAYRVAVGESPRSGSVPPSRYRSIAEAYTDAARNVGETPRDLQAITWVVAQDEGLASRRRGRHDVTHKAGTPDFVRSLLDAD